MNLSSHSSTRTLSQGEFGSTADLAVLPVSLATEIQNALSSLRFGKVRIDVQDGRITLIERMERRRIVTALRADSRRDP